MSEFEEELRAALNRSSKENDSNTPDFILAGFLTACLDAFGASVRAREEWYGRKFSRGSLGGEKIEPEKCGARFFDDECVRAKGHPDGHLWESETLKPKEPAQVPEVKVGDRVRVQGYAVQSGAQTHVPSVINEVVTVTHTTPEIINFYWGPLMYAIHRRNIVTVLTPEQPKEEPKPKIGSARCKMNGQFYECWQTERRECGRPETREVYRSDNQWHKDSRTGLPDRRSPKTDTAAQRALTEIERSGETWTHRAEYANKERQVLRYGSWSAMATAAKGRAPNSQGRRKDDRRG